MAQVDDVAPLGDGRDRAARGVPVEEAGVVRDQTRVMGGVVVDHVDHDPHAQRMDAIDEVREVVPGAIRRVHRAIVRDRVGTALAPLASGGSDRVDGHEPHDVRAEGLDALEVRVHVRERATGPVGAHEDLVDHQVPDVP